MLSPEEVAKRRQALEERRERKRQERRRQLILIVLVVGIGLLLMGVTAWVSYRSSATRRVQGVAMSPQSERYHVLLLGVDAQMGARARADTVLVASIEPSTGHIGILSIPRDTRVYIPENNRHDRINAVYAHGGVDLVLDVVSDFLGEPIRHYVKTDFHGFRRIIDTLGGVEIEVEQAMNYVDSAQDLTIDIQPGKQRLDGENALHYIRYRDRLGDVALVDPVYQNYGGRVARQGKFINALIQEILSPRTLPKIPTLLRQTWSIVDTNLPWDAVFDLAINGTKFSPDKVEITLVPGNSGVLGGASYWIADEDRLSSVVDMVLFGKPVPLTLQVLNGNGRAGVATQASNQLTEQGYDVVNTGNADHYNYAQTRVVISEAGLQERVKDLAESLDAIVMVEKDYNKQVDVTVIIGKNYSVTDRSGQI